MRHIIDILLAPLGGTGYAQCLSGGGAVHKSGGNDGVHFPGFCVDDRLCDNTSCG